MHDQRTPSQGRVSVHNAGVWWVANELTRRGLSCSLIPHPKTQGYELKVQTPTGQRIVAVRSALPCNRSVRRTWKKTEHCYQYQEYRFNFHRGGKRTAIPFAHVVVCLGWSEDWRVNECLIIPWKNVNALMLSQQISSQGKLGVSYAQFRSRWELIDDKRLRHPACELVRQKLHDQGFCIATLRQRDKPYDFLVSHSPDGVMTKVAVRVSSKPRYKIGKRVYTRTRIPVGFAGNYVQAAGKSRRQPERLCMRPLG